MKPIIFDIETGPLPPTELASVMPVFEASKVLKDPEKIAADIAKKREEWIADAALSAVTGRILAIEFLEADGYSVLTGDERDMLNLFWNVWRQQARTWIGHNVIGFDFPFIIRRSMILGVPVPNDVRKGRYLSDLIRDTMVEWACGTRDMVSLDTLAKSFGVGKKTGSGTDFAKLFLGGKEEEALAYLENDCRVTHAVAKRMGLC